jgi:hypothetical protein
MPKLLLNPHTTRGVGIELLSRFTLRHNQHCKPGQETSEVNRLPGSSSQGPKQHCSLLYPVRASSRSLISAITPIYTPAPAPCNAIQLLVITVSGRTITVTANETDSILSLKSLIFDKDGTPPCVQCLHSNGRQLEDDRSIHFYGLSNLDCIHVFFDCLADTHARRP